MTNRILITGAAARQERLDCLVPAINKPVFNLAEHT